MLNKSLIHHYFTVAVHSLERYKTQSVISIVGLAVGFVCLLLSAFWVNYTNTYNIFISYFGIDTRVSLC